VIKAIVFDFFGVICSNEYWQLAKDYSQANFDFQKSAEQTNLGSIPWQSFISKLAAATNKTTDEVNQMYSSERLDPRLIGLIEILHKKYKIGLLTNANHQFIDDILNRNNILRLFDTVVISSKEGIIKPDPKIYQLVLDRLGVKAQESIYIDDLEKHVEGANKLGIHGILYKDFNNLQLELSRLI
jgi:epoxide hydrolase-like predicted phosphatase